MNKFLVSAVVVALVFSGLSVWGQKAEEQEPNFFMKKKLEFSQHILAGLATSDFDRISDAATSMNNLNQIEKWSRRTNAEAYRTQLRVFRFANEELVRQANRKNIDGAALAFSQLTLSCVNCHKVLRETPE